MIDIYYNIYYNILLIYYMNLFQNFYYNFRMIRFFSLNFFAILFIIKIIKTLLKHFLY